MLFYRLIKFLYRHMQYKEFEKERKKSICDYRIFVSSDIKQTHRLNQIMFREWQENKYFVLEVREAFTLSNDILTNRFYLLERENFIKVLLLLRANASLHYTKSKLNNIYVFILL